MCAPLTGSTARRACRGNTKDTRGTAYVVYEDIYDAKAAADHLSGFNVANRYLIVLFYQPARQAKKLDQVRPRPESGRLGSACIPCCSDCLTLFFNRKRKRRSSRS